MSKLFYFISLSCIINLQPYSLEVGLARSLRGFARMNTISSCKALRQEILREMVLHDSRVKNHCMFLRDQSCKPFSDISLVNHARPLPPNKCKSVCVHPSRSMIIKENQLHIIQILIQIHCHSVQHQLDFHLRRHHSQEEEGSIQAIAHLAATLSNVHG